MTIILFILAFFMVISLAVLLLYVLLQATKNKTAMGINLQKTNCPQCGEPAPRIRKPANTRQALFGGWTCQKCATECDKWGRVVTEAGSGK